MKKRPIYPMIIAFIVRVYPYMFLSNGWVIEDGPIIYWLRMFLSGSYQYLRLYPHTGILGMSLLTWIGVPFELAAKVWGPLMGSLTTYFVYKLLKTYNLDKTAIYGATIYACLGSSIYRSCSLATSLEATAVCLMTLFLWRWKTGDKRSYLLLPLIAYTHFIVFFATIVYLFGTWWVNTESSFNRRILVFCGLCVGGLVLLRFLPVGYALYQVLRTITNVDLSKLVYLYSTQDYVILATSLAVTTGIFLVTVFYSRIKEIKTISILYGLAVIFTMLFHSPIVSPYRLMLHMGLIGVVGVTSFFENMDQKRTKIIVVLICLLSLYQTSSVGYDEHVNFGDSFDKDETEMLTWLHEYDPMVDYSRLLWDDVGIENALTALPLIVALDPYSTRSEDYGLWHEEIEFKRVLINQSIGDNDIPNGGLVNQSISYNDILDGDDGYQLIIDHDPTPGHVLYVMYSKRYAERALYRLPEEYNKLVYRNYLVKNIWHNLTAWNLIYEKDGNKIYERRMTK